MTRRTARSLSPRRAARLGFELLEDRVTPAALALPDRLAVGVVADGHSTVNVYALGGVQLGSIDVTDLAGTGQAHYAVADVTGDGTADIVVGSGPGVVNQFRVYNGRTFEPVFTGQPFESTFTGGVNVSVGDIDKDGKADIVVSPDVGGGPRVLIYRGGDYGQAADFLGITDKKFRGGVRTAVGDINKDGTPDLVVAAGNGGGPRVVGYNGTSLLSGTPAVMFDTFVFEKTVTNGAYVALGDVNRDGSADLIAGAGPGGAPRVLVLNGAALVTGTQTALANFYAGATTDRNGAPVGAANLDLDDVADVTSGAWAGVGSGVLGFVGTTLGSTSPTQLFKLLSDPGGIDILSTVAAPVPAATPPAPTASNALLTLQLNPLDVNLLGLEITTSPITVTVSAEPGSGALLGNALTLASSLVNLPGVSDALNTVLANVVTLLNSASLGVGGVGSGTFDTAAAATTPILDAFVAPVHLNLLGAKVDTSPIHLTITAHSGPGLVLGNAVTALANLFNPPLPSTLDVAFINSKLADLINQLNAQIPTIPATFSPPPPIPAGSDRILQLVVAPINLNLLGLNLQTSQINVNADAHTGNGLLLGNVLTTLLNTLNATPDQLTQLSNNINTLLAKVIGVLNASNLTLAAGSIDALSPLIQQLTGATLVSATPGQTVPVLNLMIASTDGTTPPVDVSLLGLEITTSDIQARLTATTGDGLILGNLVYNVSHLLDPGGVLGLLGLLGQLGV